MHGAVTGDAGLAGKAGCTQGDAKVAFAAFLEPGMAAMRLAFVDDVKHLRRESCLKLLANFFQTFHEIFPCPFPLSTNGLNCHVRVEKVRAMSKPDPFGFDMSVSSAKKKNPRGRRSMSGASETSQRVCDHEGCKEKGLYRAPKAPDVLDDFFWFCKDHVREYNAKVELL